MPDDAAADDGESTEVLDQFQKLHKLILKGVQVLLNKNTIFEAVTYDYGSADIVNRMNESAGGGDVLQKEHNMA